MATTSYDGKCDCGSNLYVWIEEEILIELLQPEVMYLDCLRSSSNPTSK